MVIIIDVLIIGCGIIGASVAYELSRFNLSVTAVDRLNDIAGETTRANSGIVHAGFDPEPGSIIAKYNVRGNEMIRKLCSKLDVPYIQNGSLVVGFDEKDTLAIEVLHRRGLEFGVSGIEIITGDRARQMEEELGELAETLRRTKSRIVVEKIMYHGVSVQIGNFKMEVNDDITTSILKAEDGRITVKALVE